MVWPLGARARVRLHMDRDVGHPDNMVLAYWARHGNTAAEDGLEGTVVDAKPGSLTIQFDRPIMQADEFTFDLQLGGAFESRGELVNRKTYRAQDVEILAPPLLEG